MAIADTNEKHRRLHVRDGHDNVCSLCEITKMIWSMTLTGHRPAWSNSGNRYIYK